MPEPESKFSVWGNAVMAHGSSCAHASGANPNAINRHKILKMNIFFISVCFINTEMKNIVIFCEDTLFLCLW